MPDPTNVQLVLFKHIKSAINANISLVDDIAELLGISTDSAYRRIRGEKELTISELQQLALHYHISLNELFGATGEGTLFLGKNLDTDHFNFEDYLSEINLGLKTILAASTKKMFYEAKDLPIFYHFQFPELATFKYFFWMRSVMYYPGYQKMQFEDNELTPLFQKMGKEIITTYSKIPSAEIWTTETISATIRQIGYYYEAGIFRSKDTIAKLYEQLTTLVGHVKEQAEHGGKYLIGQQPSAGSAAYELYHNEVFLGHNTIVAETDGRLTTYINHAVMNFMRTHDEGFCRYTLQSIQNNMKKSVLISKVGEKERNRFFNVLLGQVERARVGVLG